MAKADLTAQSLRELLNYDDVAGTFEWRSRALHWFIKEADWTTWNKRFAGKPAGSIRKQKIGTVCFAIGLLSKHYLAHRVAWTYMTGEWPAQQIDHIDGDSMNNRWVNLRLADSRLNAENKRKARSDNASGLLGVNRRGSVFIARIGSMGRSIYLGRFASAQEAHAAYIGAKRRLHAGCTI